MVRSRLWLSALALVALAALLITPRLLVASNHDDGELDLKGRALHTTDLFVFREQDQNPGAAAGDLVFIMNVNPRSLPRQEYAFSTNAQYDIHVTRAMNNDAMPTGKTDAMLRFQFGAPGQDGSQPIKVTAVRDGVTTAGSMGARTTPLAAAAAPIVTPVTLGGGTISVFAGLREDPFFFDVAQFFRVRADAAGPIVAEAKHTLMAFGNDDKRATALLVAFLPDVMRIDTTGPSGYGAALNAKGSPIRGRKITDDVIHVTLSVVTNGAVKTDNVTYAGPNGGGTVHKPLLTSFPYLADPN